MLPSTMVEPLAGLEPAAADPAVPDLVWDAAEDAPPVELAPGPLEATPVVVVSDDEAPPEPVTDPPPPVPALASAPLTTKWPGTAAALI